MDQGEQEEKNIEGMNKMDLGKRSMIFTIKTDVFEGPLDLLLTLIEKRKLFINDISLGKVTDEYIQYINRLGDYSFGDRTQFIYIASTLLLIKAKSLLPTLQLTEDEQTDMEDLENRLKELAIIRKASEGIQKAFGSRILFPRGDFKIDMKLFVPSREITMDGLVVAIGSVINSLPKKATPPKIHVGKVMSLEEMIIKLTDRVKSAIRMSFREFSNGFKNPKEAKSEKVHVIVSFLAMLELVKQGTIEAHQEGLFDEIQMESHELGVPRYN